MITNDTENNGDENYQNLPNIWFRIKFPAVYKKHNDAVKLATTKNGVFFVQSISEEFLAEAVGILGNPTSPIVYVNRENRFYCYESDHGIYTSFNKSQMTTKLSAILHQCASECEKPTFCDTTSLRFQLSKCGQLNGVIEKAKGLLAVSESFFESSIEEFIACRNGMLRLVDMQLLPFDPKYRRRNKLSVSYVQEAQCPLFLDTLMRQSLDEVDIVFLQEWCGLALFGKNLPQVIVILVGIAGTGKSTFVKVITEIIGKGNVYTLRTERLGDKFETSFYLGKTLLHGVDVASDFLTQKSASVLKALTGGDTMNVEIKNNAEGGPEIEGFFNVVIICNSLPNIKLEGDSLAWKRRLVLVEYRKPKPQTVITSLADNILKEEGSGVLNWALEGLARLKVNKWRFALSQNQNDLVDKVLLQSDSPHQFVTKCIVEEKDCLLTQEDCFAGYIAFCKKVGWYPVPKDKATHIIEDDIMRDFGLTRRNDITGSQGTAQRGWKGIKIIQH